MSIRKILGRTGLVLAALVAALLVTRAILNYTTAKKLEKFLAAAKARGLPVSLADLGPACPWQDNARPLWRAGVALFDRQYPIRSKTNFSSELAKLHDSGTIEEKTRAHVRAAIADNRRPIDLLLEAAERSCFQEADRRVFTDPNRNDDLVGTLQLIRLLGFDAFLRAEGNDVRAGLDEWIKGYHFVRLMIREPWFINTLVSIANMRSLLVFLNRMIDGGVVNENDLAAILKELDVETWRAAVAGSCRGERIYLIETGKDVLQGRLDALETNSWRRFVLWLARPLVRTGLMRQYKEFDEIATMLGEPFYQSRPLLNAFDARQEQRSWFEQLPHGHPSGYSAMGLKEASLEALMETARIGLAARIYRLQEKRFPAAVADLVPSLLPREPLDPFTGKPFVFRVDKKGLLVYSLGSNEKDDGGRGTYSIAQLVTEKDDDWVWRDTIR